MHQSGKSNPRIRRVRKVMMVQMHQTPAPQRKIAGILGVSHETVRRDGGTNVPAGNAGRTDLAAFERMAGTNAPPSVARGRAAAEAQRKVAEIRLRAERKAGELLQAMEKNKGAQGNPGG